MGAVIYAYIEYDEMGQPPFGGDVRALSEGSFDINRSYGLFGALAGVRAEEQPRFPPRGLPPRLTWEVAKHFYYAVLAPGEEPEWTGEKYVSQEEAESWVHKGYSEYVHQGDLLYVTDPDAHSANWLTLPEIDEALKAHNIQPDEIPLEFHLVMDIMAVIDQRLGAGRTRLVFWFRG